MKFGIRADTNSAQKIIDHIRRFVNEDGIAPITSVLPNFPAVRKQLDPTVSAYKDLRHMANLRGSGNNEQDKGLIELGILLDDVELQDFPEEVNAEAPLYEGALRRISVNAYERSRAARNKCIEKWGLNCVVCDFNFEEFYGERGIGFIHVHHLKPISSIGAEYELDPVKHLRPVCPNCHAIIHRDSPPLSIEDARKIVVDRRADSA